MTGFHLLSLCIKTCFCPRCLCTLYVCLICECAMKKQHNTGKPAAIVDKFWNICTCNFHNKITIWSNYFILDINFLNNISNQYLVVENYIFYIMYINIYLYNIIHHGIIHLSLMHFHSSTLMLVCSYVWKKHHKNITISVNPIWNASKDWPPFKGLSHRHFLRKQRERGCWTTVCLSNGTLDCVNLLNLL